MAKNKKQETETDTEIVDKNSNNENSSLEGESNLSQSEVDSKISSEMIKALEEKVLRAHAEVENIRRTSQKEILKARVYSAELIIKDLLSPIDNLTRSLEHSEEEIPFADFLKNYLNA